MSLGKTDFWKPRLLAMKASLWATHYRKLETCALGFWLCVTWASMAVAHGPATGVKPEPHLASGAYPRHGFLSVCSFSFSPFLLIFFIAIKILGYDYFPFMGLLPKYLSLMRNTFLGKPSFTTIL